MPDLVSLRAEIEDCSDCTIDGLDLCAEHNRQLSVSGEPKSRLGEMKEALQTTDRHFSTFDDIANDIDVTTQTVLNHSDELLEDPTVEYRKVGQATVLWLKRERESNLECDHYIPSDAYKRALERNQSLASYLDDLISVETALEDAGFQKTREK